MKTTSTSTIQRRGGCGCGGASGCSCAMPSCGTCDDQGFARPRFFAGQLLTEDDLQALTDYLAGKNRLHNRMLFGDGVVCGLNVACSPCDDGKVMVQPGYALDCCGNDIVVSCAQTVDVKALLRKLQDESFGPYGCAAPCGDPKPKAPAPEVPPPASAVDASSYAAPREKMNVTIPAQAPALPQRDRYCLYLRYCEQRTDLVSPYGASAPCGPGECQPTRVREGYSFELRCRQDEPASDIVSAVVACFGDIAKLDRATADSAVLQKQAKRLAAAVELAEATDTPKFTSRDVDRMMRARATLQSWLGGVSDKDVERVMIGADGIGEAAGMIARYRLSDGSALEEPWAQNLEQEIASTDSVLKQAAPELAKRGSSLDPQPTPLQGAYLDAAGQIAATTDFSAARYGRLWAEGVVYTEKLESAYVTALEGLRRTVLSCAVPDRPTADCRLPKDVASLRLPMPGRGGKLGAAKEIETAVVVLVGALLRMLLDCVCQAITPPCAPCDDSAVLIACLDVEDCRVTGICNTERKLVLTGPAARYWFPPIGWFGELLELLCCTLRDGIADATSFRALASWLGGASKDGGYQLDLGARHAVWAAQSYYGRNAPSDRELYRLPNVLSQFASAAAYRMDVPTDAGKVYAPSAPQEPANAPPPDVQPAPARPHAMAPEMAEAAGGELAVAIDDIKGAQERLRGTSEKFQTKTKQQLDALTKRIAELDREMKTLQKELADVARGRS